MKLREEQRNTEAQLERIEHGELPERRRRVVEQRWNRLRSIIDRAHNVYDLNYVRTVAHNFTF